MGGPSGHLPRIKPTPRQHCRCRRRPPRGPGLTWGGLQQQLDLTLFSREVFVKSLPKYKIKSTLPSRSRCFFWAKEPEPTQKKPGSANTRENVLFNALSPYSSLIPIFSLDLIPLFPSCFPLFPSLVPLFPSYFPLFPIFVVPEAFLEGEPAPIFENGLQPEPKKTPAPQAWYKVLRS